MVKSIVYILIIFYLSFQESIFSQSYNYQESFETNNSFEYWTSNGSYTINYFGLSNEKASEGNSSLKMDLSISGSGDKECYYYWKLPVNTNLHGTLDFSADLFMDSTTAQYVKIGYHYIFPPTSIERTPTPAGVTKYNQWVTQSLRVSDDVIYHADYFAKNKIYGSTYQDFGRELQFIHLIIKAKGAKRLIFYIDNVRLTGEIMSPLDYKNYYLSSWDKYQLRLSGLKQTAHSKFDTLPIIPDTTGKSISNLALGYYNQLKDLLSDMTTLFSIIDNQEYFDTAVMDSLNYKLNIFPSIALLLNNEMLNSYSPLDVYTFPSTTYNRLDETNFPSGLSSFENIQIRICREEYEPFSLLLQAKERLGNIKITWTNFTGSAGVLDSSIMDASIAKVWYQAGLTEIDINNKLLTQELLIKNDNLIKIDRNTRTNYLQVKKQDGTVVYTDVSTPSAIFPDNVTVEDSKTLLPFSIEANSNKQLWFTIKAPVANAGIYESTVSIKDNNKVYRNFILKLEILPFKLDPSRLTYGMYYNGYLDKYLNRPFHFTNKTEAQLLLELKDMKEHGILYPTTYQVYSKLDNDLKIRNQAGLPSDKLFAVGFKTSNPQTSAELSNLKTLVNNWKAKISQYGYKDLYVYGIDEASGDLLRSQKPAWQAIKESGGNIFVAGYDDLIMEMRDLIDVGVVLGTHNTEQAKLYHKYGRYIFSYSNPQAGHENPEIYRRNFGIALWKAGYDGAMDYAYQKNYGSTWNDFDGTKYRDQNFTYPATNSVLSTIQWEGFREAIDDVKYLSTLLNRIDFLKSSGVNLTEIEEWVSNIDCSGDLDALRNDLIDKILYLQNISIPVESLPGITQVSFVDSTLLKITFNKCIDPSTLNPGNFLIIPSLQIFDLKLSTDLRTIFVKTSPHKSYIMYNLEINNVTDIYETPPIKNYYEYSFSTVRTKIKIYLQGAYHNGVMNTSLNSVLPTDQPFSQTPWNYKGSEKMAFMLSGIVDWVLVELRDAANSIVCSKAALLSSTGQIVDTDGSEYLKFNDQEPGNYYISVRHRNHLGILTSVPWYITDSQQLIDLTIPENVNSKCSLIKLDETSYGLRSGDCDGNGKVEVIDYKFIKTNFNQTGYLNGDLNLDGIVNNSDYIFAKSSLFRYSTVK